MHGTTLEPPLVVLQLFFISTPGALGDKGGVIADFTTLGESHFVWPSPIPLQTP